MPFSLRERVRRARPLALVLAAAAACSDPMAPDASPDVASATSAELTAAAAIPSVSRSVSTLSSTSTALTGSAGTVVSSSYSYYNLRVGPGTSYAKIGTIRPGTAVTVVCTATRTSSGGTTVWSRLSTGAWMSGTYIALASGAPTPPACDSPAGPKVTAGVRGDDYPFKGASASGCSHDEWGFCVRQCTSFVTWRLRNVNGVAHFRYSYGGTSWGSAKDWDDAARRLGYRVDRTPAVGAVAQWTSSSSGQGHVAWVASVSADGRSVTIEEYNYRVSRGYSARTVSTSSVDNFIHLY
jgi:surface antigen